MNARILAQMHGRLIVAALGVGLLAGCASDGDYWGGGGGVSTSVSVGVGYGSYYGPGWYGGYYDPYPPVVIVPPGDRPDRPTQLPERPTTLPADVGRARPAPAGATPRAMTAPPRPPGASRPISRPSPRPAPRPMPRMGRR